MPGAPLEILAARAQLSFIVFLFSEYIGEGPSHHPARCCQLQEHPAGKFQFCACFLFALMWLQGAAGDGRKPPHAFLQHSHPNMATGREGP